MHIWPTTGLALASLHGPGEVFGNELGDSVELTPYDESWPVRAALLADGSARRSDPRLTRVDHIGSTAIPSLAAKPVLDLQVVVPDWEDEDSYRPAIESFGCTLRYREPPDWAYFRRMHLPRDVHVYVTGTRSKREHAQLLFRDSPAGSRAPGGVRTTQT